MNSETLLKNSQIFIERINVKLDGLSLPGDSNALASMGLTHMSLEYFESIIHLMSRGAYRSSGVLIRPQYEALVRGLYYFHCASTVKADNFLSGAEAPKIYEMIKELEKLPGFDSGNLSRFHSKNSRMMHDLTHGGIEQHRRSFTGNELSSNFTDKDKYDLLKSSSLLGVTAASNVAAIADAIDLAKSIQQDFQELCAG